MPYLDVARLRGQIYRELDELRRLRNRIAHHEPIFKRNLAVDFKKIEDLICLRCPIAATWMVQNQQATKLIEKKPH